MEIEKLYKYLPPRLLFHIHSLPRNILECAGEIRLRRNYPLSISAEGKNHIVVSADGKAVICDGEELNAVISTVCDSSLYSFDETVKNGFIPLSDGGRAGICGDAVYRNGRLEGFGSINSICLRVARFFPNVASELVKHYDTFGLCGALVYSPPGVGKTTYLKSVIYLLSKRYRVGVADEKGELSYGKGYTLVDIITNCKKQQAIELLTLSMSPELIVCDEISPNEAEGIIAAQNSGVYLVASCHGESRDGIMKRPFIRNLIEMKVFSVLIRINYDGVYSSTLELL